VRILYLANEEIPGRMGGSVHAWEVARGLAARGHVVTALVNRGPGQEAEERIEGVRIVRGRLRVRGRMIPLRGLATAMALGRHADVILERHITPGGAGTVITRTRGIPLVLEVNSPHVEELIWRMDIRSPILRRALRAWVDWQFRACRLAVAPRANIVPACARDRVAVRGWGVDADRFRPEAADTPAAVAFRSRHDLAGRVSVLFAGSFRAWHGARDLPEIARRALARAPEIKLVLVGEGDLLTDVRAEVQALGLSKDVAVAGSVPHDEMPAVVASCAIGIAPYDTDAYAPLARFGFFWSPLKIFEYMACGLPVVLFGYEGLREHVGESERGLAVTPRDLDAFAGAIAMLARDAASRRGMGERARDYVLREHTWRDHVAWLDARLQEAAGARAAERAR